jgi:hypothetical protein
VAYVEPWVENQQSVGQIYVKKVDGTQVTTVTTIMPIIAGIDW